LTDKKPDWSDAAKRASDIINGYRAFVPWDELIHKVVAIRLSDGGSDGVLYDSKRDAVRHQLDEFLCAYVHLRNLVGGASPREMEIFLKWNRDAYDAGFRLPDPDDVKGGPELIMQTLDYDKRRMHTPAMSPREEQIFAEMLGLKDLDYQMMKEILES